MVFFQFGCLFLVLLLAGCGGALVKTPESVIEEAKALKGTKAKVVFLVDNAKTFFDAGQYYEAIEVAEFVVDKLERTNVDARRIIKRSQKKQGAGNG